MKEGDEEEEVEMTASIGECKDAASIAGDEMKSRWMETGVGRWGCA